MSSIALWRKVLATLTLSLEILLPIITNFSLRNALSYLSVVLRNIFFGFILPIFPYQLAFFLVNSFVLQCQRVRVFVLRNVRDRLRQAYPYGVHFLCGNYELYILNITKPFLFIELELR